MIGEAVFLVIRLVIGGMFLLALVSKMRDLASFRSAVRGFRVVPRHLERPVAFAVLGAEAAVVVLVTVRSSAAIGLTIATVLLVAFATGMARVVARGDRVPCGCFGRSAAPISTGAGGGCTGCTTDIVVGLRPGQERSTPCWLRVSCCWVCSWWRTCC